MVRNPCCADCIETIERQTHEIEQLRREPETLKRTGKPSDDQPYEDD